MLHIVAQCIGFAVLVQVSTAVDDNRTRGELRCGPYEPPQLPAITACKGKHEGERCKFAPRPSITPLQGNCTVSEIWDKKVMWCKPDGDGSGKRPGVAACNGKDEGESCDFSPNWSRKPLKGNCTWSQMKDNKFLWCKPNAKPDVPPAVAACEAKNEGEQCNFSVKWRVKPLQGKCVLSQTKDKKVMWCKPHVPVPPAIAVCDGKSEGEACKFPSKWFAKTLKGNCTLSSIKKVLWCKPGKPDVPPVAVAACKGKDEGESCKFFAFKPPSRRVDLVKGQCTFSDQLMWCKPSQSDEDGSEEQEESPSVVACESKDEGERCKFSFKWRTKPLQGKCTLSMKNGKKVMRCKPEGDGSGKPNVPPAVAACKGKDEGETCGFSLDKGVAIIAGKCVLSLKKSVMWCKANSDGSGKPDAPPAVSACKGKDEGDQCEFSLGLGMRPRKGKCTWSDKKDEKKAIKSGDVVFLRTRSGNGKHIHVEDSKVQALWTSRGNWQAMVIEKGERRNGDIIKSGDTVYLQTHTGRFIDVQGVSVQATWNDKGLWQSFQVVKRSGSGAILPDDVICLRAHTGHYLEVEDTLVQARWDECGDWQSMQIEKEVSGAVFSGDAIQLAAHTGKFIDVQGDVVQARWSDAGKYQTFAIENPGGRAIFAGDAVFLTAHTGNVLHVKDTFVQATWNDKGAWQRFHILKKDGSGAIMPGDAIFLQAHTGKFIDIQGASVQANWNDKGDWQILKIKKVDLSGRLLEAADDEPAIETTHDKSALETTVDDSVLAIADAELVPETADDESSPEIPADEPSLATPGFVFV